MITAQVLRNDKVLFERLYAAPALTLESVMKLIEMYIINEQINNEGECLIRVKHNAF